MTLNTWSLILTVIIAHLIALLSPGPDFILVVKSAVRRRARDALGVAVGMTLAVFAWDAFIILVLAQQRVKELFARIAVYIDKRAGGILGLVGLRLVQTALLDER